MKKAKYFLSLGLIISVLSGCSSLEGGEKKSTEDGSDTRISLHAYRGEYPANVDKENPYNPSVSNQEITLYVENTVTFQSPYTEYVFNGFLGTDTLMFSDTWSQNAVAILHPAKIGYQFRFQERKNVQFEVIDFDRDKGFVKLKATLTTSIESIEKAK